MTEKKKNLLWIGASLLCFGLSFILCRYIFFDLHGMKQWTELLAIIALIVLAFALFLKKRATAVMTIFGYIGGFAIAMIFRTTSLDQGGGTKSNGWLIWTLALLICVIIGVLLDVYKPLRLKKKGEA